MVHHNGGVNSIASALIPKYHQQMTQLSATAANHDTSPVDTVIRQIARDLKQPDQRADEWIATLKDNLYDTVESLRSMSLESWCQCKLPLRLFEEIKKRFPSLSYQGCANHMEHGWPLSQEQFHPSVVNASPVTDSGPLESMRSPSSAAASFHLPPQQRFYPQQERPLLPSISATGELSPHENIIEASFSRPSSSTPTTPVVASPPAREPSSSLQQQKQQSSHVMSPNYSHFKLSRGGLVFVNSKPTGPRRASVSGYPSTSSPSQHAGLSRTHERNLRKRSYDVAYNSSSSSSSSNSSSHNNTSVGSSGLSSPSSATSEEREAVLLTVDDDCAEFSPWIEDSSENDLGGAFRTKKIRIEGGTNQYNNKNNNNNNNCRTATEFVHYGLQPQFNFCCYHHSNNDASNNNNNNNSQPTLTMEQLDKMKQQRQPQTQQSMVFSFRLNKFNKNMFTISGGSSEGKFVKRPKREKKAVPETLEPWKDLDHISLKNLEDARSGIKERKVGADKCIQFNCKPLQLKSALKLTVPKRLQSSEYVYTLVKGDKLYIQNMSQDVVDKGTYDKQAFIQEPKEIPRTSYLLRRFFFSQIE